MPKTNLVVRSQQFCAFWSKVERIFGEIPNLLKIILEFNGFDTFLALKGIQWDDKNFFFQALEESIVGLTELDDSDSFKIKIKEELRLNHLSLEKFKLKLGHKNLIINLCNELQKTNIDDFNATYATVQVSETPQHHRTQTDLVVRKQPDEEHGYSREDDEEADVEEEVEEKIQIASPPAKRRKLFSTNSGSNVEIQEVETALEPAQSEQIQYIYEDEEGNQFLDHEYIDEDNEIVEYQEISAEDIDSSGGSGIFNAEQIVKSEADQFEQAECYEIRDFEQNMRNKLEKSKKPVHMYTDEFLQLQISLGRVATPGRRRPKLQKQYKIETEEGLLEKWSDLVRQSCEVIIPQDLLMRFDLSNIEIVKTLPNIWEVRCPMCTKKLRLQLTHEGKYVNFKRSNFERHLRIVHYKQIAVFKPEDQEHAALLEEIHTD